MSQMLILTVTCDLGRNLSSNWLIKLPGKTVEGLFGCSFPHAQINLTRMSQVGDLLR